jgi:hypothetical protein
MHRESKLAGHHGRIRVARSRRERRRVDDLGNVLRIAGGAPRREVHRGIGAGSITVSLLFDFNLSAFVVEAAWVAVSIYGLVRAMRARRIA